MVFSTFLMNFRSYFPLFAISIRLGEWDVAAIGAKKQIARTIIKESY
jgi:hypothetical protein